jgi:putative membrane protein
MWDSDWGWGGMMGGGLGMILFWGLIILLIVLAVRWLGAFGSSRGSAALIEKTPLQVLQERYARGEIDKEEYEERRKTLTDQHQASSARVLAARWLRSWE